MKIETLAKANKLENLRIDALDAIQKFQKRRHEGDRRQVDRDRSAIRGLFEEKCAKKATAAVARARKSADGALRNAFNRASRMERQSR